MHKNYIVKFVRKDNLPDEEYIYHSHQDAEHHFSLFRHDDSGIYKKIEMLSWFGNITAIIKEISFV